MDIGLFKNIDLNFSLGSQVLVPSLSGLWPISSFKVNESLQKVFDAEHSSAPSHTLAPDDAPRLAVKTHKHQNAISNWASFHWSLIKVFKSGQSTLNSQNKAIYLWLFLSKKNR